MRMVVDTSTGEIWRNGDGMKDSLPLYSREGFELLSRLWLKVGWNQKYMYTFSWFGRPVIQLPEDLIRVQEVLYRVKPDVIIETGVAHGGSVVFYATLCKAMGRGRVIGIDIEIRPHNRAAIAAHEMAALITLIEGSSTDSAVAERVKSLVRPDETVMVLLDADHTKEFVLAELEAYGPLVTAGSYVVVMDGIMEELHDVPRGQPEWATDNPAAAARGFAKRHPEFEIEQPPWPFNESELARNVTHWGSAWLRRR